ncbi:AEC family transporter [Salinisphaera sp. T31B1]|uniref:AEC family transporter n=1 Tax=Salinisphaera sp. T31B1 TaxID=727963 RepID=UPI00334092C0
MGSVINVLLPIFGLILAGYICRRTRRLGATAASELNRFVVWLCLPALLFESTANASWAAIWHPGFIAVSVLSTLGVFILTLACRLRGPLGLTDASIDALGASYANTGYIGIPLCVLVLGDEGLVPALIATLVVVCVLFGVAVVCVEIGLQAERTLSQAVVKVLSALVRNPLVVAPAVGGVWAASGLTLIEPAAKFLHLMGLATTPCALVSLGAFLAQSKGIHARGAPGLVALKLVAQPALAWVLAAYVFDLPLFWAQAALLLAALPTGTGPYMLAEFYHREASVVSSTILLSTLGSLLTLSFCLYLIAS